MKATAWHAGEDGWMEKRTVVGERMKRLIIAPIKWRRGGKETKKVRKEAGMREPSVADVRHQVK